jgi:Flp pilus assembly pilin Flp
MNSALKRMRNKKGQGTVEYLIVGVVIALAVVTLIGTGKLDGMLGKVVDKVDTEVNSIEFK